MTQMAMNILIRYDSEDQVWLAHCLELDVMESGVSQRSAVRQLIRNIDLLLEECAKDNTTLFDPAPQEYWTLLSKATPVENFSDLDSDEFSDDFILPPSTVLRELHV